MDVHAFEENKENLALGGKEDYKKFMEEENHEHQWLKKKADERKRQELQASFSGQPQA